IILVASLARDPASELYLQKQRGRAVELCHAVVTSFQFIESRAKTVSVIRTISEPDFTRQNHLA
ncbi:MAG: hypothetical protein ACF8CQ_09785, partial [Rhodopirellula sp. JB044]|uniref:hypothetical protein n=1 Tax=Rhodopirellula sp. JB044 TaxID=3342844 RepID=UPI003709D5AE